VPSPISGSPSAQVFVLKSVYPDRGRIGDELEFVIRVGNKGSVAAKSVVMTDTLPDYLDILEATASRGAGSVQGQTIRVDIGTVEPDEVITIRVRTRINALAQPSVGFNTAVITTSSTSDDPSDNTSTVVFTIIPGDGPQAPVPTPEVVPPELPRTGAADNRALGGPLIAMLGFMLLAMGILLRRRIR
jgi:uncharacterized repeat protein (TIGR01451 family)